MGLALKEVAAEFAVECRQFEDDLKGLLVVEVFNFPMKLDIGLLDDIAVILHAFSPVYLARPNPGWTDFRVFANCNFQGVALDLRNKPWPVDKVAPYLQEFVNSARANRLPVYLHGVATSQIADAAGWVGGVRLHGRQDHLIPGRQARIE